MSQRLNPAHLLSAPPDPPCEACEQHNGQIFYCVNCDGHFCLGCWPRERSHKPGKLGPDGYPHEKAELEVVNRLRATFNVPIDRESQDRLHLNDEDTTWFGISRDSMSRPIFQDYGRYATLIANSASPENGERFPRLVSFIGQTGAGKSTLIKMLIERLSSLISDPEARGQFKCPVPGSVNGYSTPTSGDVHLYANPSMYYGPFPTFYADCEGLEGGEVTPIALRHRKDQDGQTSPSKFQKKMWRLSRSQQRHLAWANSPEKEKRQYAVGELYPRLLYTFSDVVVFVLQNAKTFESSVLVKLVDWAAAVIEKSTNQPVLPHAIIAVNAMDPRIDSDQWETEVATELLMKRIDGAVGRDPKFRQYCDFWNSNGRPIRSTRDLLHCYYSSIKVVHIPRKDRYMLLEQQIQKLDTEIADACQQSYDAKRRSRMLASADELNQYIQAGFDHFSQNLDLPFNFVEVAFRNSPIPRDFGGNILKLAVAMRDSQEESNGPKIFEELSIMVASCIVLDCTRHGLKGHGKDLFRRNYQSYCDDALRDFCTLFWPCSFENRGSKCVNVHEGHSKGHQNKKGRVIGTGAYQSSFTFESHQTEWQQAITNNIIKEQKLIAQEMRVNPTLPEKELVASSHRQTVHKFFRNLGGSQNFKSHSACFCCLQNMPEHPLPCGHVLCTMCVRTYSENDDNSGYNSQKKPWPYDANAKKYFIELYRCPLHRDWRFVEPWYIKIKPQFSGIRILSLDGGGIRGIVELEVLRGIERYLGGQIPVQAFFDLIVGTSTGGIIAMGLGVQNWSVDSCIEHFHNLSDKAFTPRIPRMNFRRKYRTSPFEKALQGILGEESLLFGGDHAEYPSYFIQVAITATTDTGEKPVIFTNYNREAESQASYTLVRPDEPKHELKLWEVLRATSAAPNYFKAFVQKETNAGYLDGALYHNNPVRVALHECKLLWRDVRDSHPDILLSIGTGHNGVETHGAAEPLNRRDRRREITSDIFVSPSPRSRNFGLEKWFKRTEIVQNLSVMVNRIDNVLNSEQIWMDFKNDSAPTWREQNEPGWRYQRINPKLGFKPPPIDDKAQLVKIQQTVRDSLKKDPYLKKITRVAHHLVASSFYFEKGVISVSDSGEKYCRGQICCKFPNGSDELRYLGKFLKRHQVYDTFQPYFRINEENQPSAHRRIDPEIIEKMCAKSHFDMGSLFIPISPRHGAVTIALAMWDIAQREILIPISGFPRNLILEGYNENRLGGPRRTRVHLDTRSTTRLRQVPLEEERPLSLYDEETAQGSNSAGTPLFAELPSQDRDWLTQRRVWTVDSITNRLQSSPRLDDVSSFPAPNSAKSVDPQPRMPFLDDRQDQAYADHASSRVGPRSTPASLATGLLMYENLGNGPKVVSPSNPIAELPDTSGSFTISAQQSRSVSNPVAEQSQEQIDDDRFDEDERALTVAIERSLRSQNRWTAGGTNLQELQQALVSSLYEQ